MARHLTTALFGLALLACCVSPAAAQRWKYPPGPPYRTCPDSVTLFSVQNPDTTQAPCHPATLDTVLGVRGIITAFDARPSAYGFYIQNTFATGPQPWTGVDVFTGAFNYNAAVPGTPTGGNLARGDSVVIYGTTQEFPATNGETEIEGPDAVQSTNDIIIRKISSGNALPAPKVGTTAQYNWIPAVSVATAEPFEGCLVRINGPLKVARVATGLGVQGNNFLIVNPAAPADSVLIDGFTLFLFGTPPLNTNVDFVQGILNQRDGASVNSYRIQLRDANDISLAAPPNLVEAYPLEDNKLRLLYDKNLDLTSAQNEANYSLGSGIDGSTVDLATLVGGAGTVVELTITSVRSDGDAESITSQNIGTASCPTCLEPSQTLNFAQGVIPISMIQAPDPANLSPCDDRSRFAGPGTAFGTRITTRGVAVHSYGSLYYIEDQAGGNRSGISIFGPLTPLVPGRKYRIACRVQEFGGETEIVNTVDILDEGVQAVPAPVVRQVSVLSDTACDASQNRLTGEDYEGMLVRVNKARVAAFANPPRDPVAGGSFLVHQNLWNEDVRLRWVGDATQEVPTNASLATGSGTVTVNTLTNTLSYNITHNVANETAAHIHGPAARGVNAGVLVGLPAGPNKVGTWNYPEAQEANILNGLTYINIHSAAFGGGEIRGQIDGFGVQQRDTILVSSLGGKYTFDADTGMVVNVTGVLHFDNGTFRILPRSNADIEITDVSGIGDGPGTIGLALNVRPNPGVSHKISFVLPKSGNVDLGVYDVLGRRVAVIASGVMEAGQHSRTWNGRLADGSKAGAGVYFYRLKQGNEELTFRAVKLN